jgi:nucleoporin POM152
MGQHTVRMSPVSTAELNAEGQKFCLSSQIGSVMIPVLLNNTNPSVLRYSLSPLDSADGETVYIDLNAKDLRHMDDAGTVQRTAASSSIPEIEEDEYDDDDSVLDSGPLLQKTQTVAHIRVSKPGVLRLEKVVHSNSVEARVTHRTAVVIAPCPSAAFVDDARTIEESSLRCSGSNEDVHMNIDVRGVPPLSLRWSKRFGTSVEHFDVEGIDSHRHDRAVTRSSSPSRSSQNIRIPLTVSATSVGHHSYTLESVSDGLGNVVHLASSNPAAGINKILHPIDFPSEHAGAITATTTRSVRVLPRARVFFQGCSASNPARLLKGQDATVILRVTDIDDSDSPLQAIVTYNPLAADEDPSVVAEGAVVEQAWTRTVQIGGSSTQLQVGSPGEYTITSAQGTKCEAEVLSPDVCKLVELPRPSADIEWQRIHEW